MLSSRGHPIREDIQGYWADEAEEPLGPEPSRGQASPRAESDPPTPVVAGAWLTIALIFVGAMTAALGVAVATALGWALWHHWPRLSRLWQTLRPPSSRRGRGSSWRGQGDVRPGSGPLPR